jgi:hypothetical protein
MGSLDIAWAEYCRLKWLVADFRLDLLRRHYARKYDPNQPRVLTGSPEGGQWTSAGGSAEAGERLQTAARRRSPSVEAECWRQYMQDKFVCNLVQSPACYGQAMLRYAICLQGLPVPPLNF